MFSQKNNTNWIAFLGIFDIFQGVIKRRPDKKTHKNAPNDAQRDAQKRPKML